MIRNDKNKIDYNKHSFVCTMYKEKATVGIFFGALVFSEHLQTTSNGTLTMTVYKPEKKEHYDQSYFALLPH